MSDSASNAHEFTVSELSGALKRSIEDQFGNVRVRGELGRISRPGSGHIYLDLKDDKSVLAGVIWKGVAARLAHQPEEGLEVIATGKLTTFPGQSKYQIIIENIEPAGAGALMALLEQRKKKLEAEGLFDPARKQLLPFLPRVIGVVTSPTGAVIRDILHRIADRFPVHVVVWPVRVQGESTPQEVSNAVRGFNALVPGDVVARPDLIIIARGGGSIEDLWGFNDEAVVRAVAESDIPVISAVGHETDWTLVDLAADVRAPTPTGAAEIAVPVKAELGARVATLLARLRSATRRGLDRARQNLRLIGRGLPTPDDILGGQRQKLDDLAQRGGRAMASRVSGERQRLASLRFAPVMLERLLRRRREQLGHAGARVSPAALARQMRDGREQVRQLGLRAERRTKTGLEVRRQVLDRLRQRDLASAVVRRTKDCRNRVDVAFTRAGSAFAARTTGHRTTLDAAFRLLASVSHQAILERGYAIVTDSDNTPIKRAKGISGGTAVHIRFADGSVDAVTGSGPTKRERTPASPAPDKAPASQASLFDEG
jgi:exodeoxyribonuclease VII large subunit